MQRRHGRITLALALALAPLAGRAQEPSSDSAFTRTEVLVPMRDSIRLFTVILSPRAPTAPLPILMVRTPYGARGVNPRLLEQVGFTDYIYVEQDIRGRFGSEGTFAMNRPPHSGHAGTDESTDTYDTIDWLLAHVANNNGKVGVWGISYPGWLAAVAGVGAHPALKAISPQAPMGDAWMGDDFFHQGAFRLSYGLEYSWMMEGASDLSVTPAPGRYDTFEWYRSFPTLGALAAAVGADRWPTWRRFVEHPAYDSVWRARALPRYFTHTTVPTLVVGGWWDQEDEYGPLATYEALERTDTADLTQLVMGPWSHGQWFADSGIALGNAWFGRPTGIDYRALQAKWFAHWLKGTADTTLAEATVFDAGTNEWRTFDHWPPAGGEHRRLYFAAEGRLSWQPPSGEHGDDAYVSDPAHPVPYRPRPVERTYSRTSRWRRWETEDQRFVDGRPDVLTWQTAPLLQAVTVAGTVVAHLYASTTGSDADWVVKLIDVYPDSVPDRPAMGGYELMVTGDIMRGRYRTSWEHAAPLTPNAVAEFTVDLHQQAYTFRAGHRIMVQVQSTWFPLYDRNPQTFVPDIFLARATAYQARTHRVYRMVRYPSSVEIETLPNAR
ncbi:MAG TPA: CocE/NonD family hydrolase [Gemmatimonadales bacterium]|nr:CocE/NonD family hydrolase [Gemmatimonadales bacterium]